MNEQKSIRWNSREWEVFWSSAHGKLVFFSIALALLIWRRPSQIFSPYIWVEDVTSILNGYVLYGWRSIFHSVNGYFITIAKLINFLSYRISFWYYPVVAVWLTVLFELFVLYMIAYAPTKLRFRKLCALGVLLIRTDAECFNIALYSFWWAGLLLILVTLWQDSSIQKSEESPPTPATYALVLALSQWAFLTAYYYSNSTSDSSCSL